MGRPSSYTEEIAKAICDWWRGYTADDVFSLWEKLEQHPPPRPGTVVPLTRGELKALLAGRVVCFNGAQWVRSD
jgi:hypothetical protein